MSQAAQSKRKLPLAAAARPVTAADVPVEHGEANPDEVDRVERSARFPEPPDATTLTDIKRRNYARYLRTLAAGKEHAGNQPLEVFFEVANSCNFSCRFCAITVKTPRPKGPTSLMQRGVMEAMGPSLAGLASVSLHGFGEPLLNRHLEQLAEACGRHGAYVEFFTNGSMLRGSRVEALRDGNVARIVVSISSADPERYAQLYKGGKLERLSAGLKQLKADKARLGLERPIILFNTILMASTLPGFPDLVRFAAEHGVGRIECKPLVIYEGIQGMHDERITYDPKQHGPILDEARALAEQAGISLSLGAFLQTAGTGEATPWDGGKPERAAAQRLDRPCPLVFRTMYVRVNGEVKPCCFASGADELSLGNVSEQSLEEIWNGPGYRALRAQHLRLEAPKTCEHCVQFNLAPPSDATVDWLTFNGFDVTDPGSLDGAFEALYEAGRSLASTLSTEGELSSQTAIEALRTVKQIGALTVQVLGTFGRLRRWLSGLSQEAEALSAFEAELRGHTHRCMQAARAQGPAGIGAGARALSDALDVPLRSLHEQVRAAVWAAIERTAETPPAPA